MEAEGPVGSYEIVSGELNHENVKDFDMPTLSAEQAGSSFIVSDYHPIDSQANLQKQKVFLGSSSFLYDPQKVMSIYFGDAKSTGINRFPKNWKKSSKYSSKQNRKNLVQALTKQVGSSCTRFLRASYSGSTTGWRNAPYAQEGSPEFVSYALCQVLFHLVKFMYGDGLEGHSKSAVKNFYLQNGQLITTSKPSSIESMRAWLSDAVKAKNSSYMVCTESYFSYCNYSSPQDRSDMMARPRNIALEDLCLRAMPDIGCPEFIAGLCL